MATLLNLFVPVTGHNRDQVDLVLKGLVDTALTIGSGFRALLVDSGNSPHVTTRLEDFADTWDWAGIAVSLAARPRSLDDCMKSGFDWAFDQNASEGLIGCCDGSGLHDPLGLPHLIRLFEQNRLDHLVGYVNCRDNQQERQIADGIDSHLHGKPFRRGGRLQLHWAERLGEMEGRLEEFLAYYQARADQTDEARQRLYELELERAGDKATLRRPEPARRVPWLPLWDLIGPLAAVTGQRVGQVNLTCFDCVAVMHVTRPDSRLPVSEAADCKADFNLVADFGRLKAPSRA